jgi:hypothetical protein
MAKFREHRGTLQESLATVVEVASLDELIAHLGPIVAPIPLTAERITIAHYAIDPRIGWDTYIVVITGHGVAGFLNGPLP